MTTKKSFNLLIAVFALVNFASTASAEMSSTNYRVKAAVVSGGGEVAASDNYSSDQTAGQSSPLMDPYDPLFSMNYDLYPGFWYAVAGLDICPADLDRDRVVDGRDIYEYIIGSPPIGLNVLAEELGRAGCTVF